MANFTEIRRGVYLPDLIAGQIMTQITTGELGPGDALPTETALAQIFGVSRNVVREAIARLRFDGVIDTKQGRGAVVKPFAERATFRVETEALESKQNLADLFELRGLLEIDAAGLAALRRTDADLDALRDAMDTMAATDITDEKRLEADAQFHRSLGQASRNDYLASFMTYLSYRLKDTSRETSRIYTQGNLIDITISEHLRILDAVAAGDRMAARDAMGAHIRGAATRLGVELPRTS